VLPSDRKFLPSCRRSLRDLSEELLLRLAQVERLLRINPISGLQDARDKALASIVRFDGA